MTYDLLCAACGYAGLLIGRALCDWVAGGPARRAERRRRRAFLAEMEQRIGASAKGNG